MNIKIAFKIRIKLVMKSYVPFHASVDAWVFKLCERLYFSWLPDKDYFGTIESLE